MTPEQMRILFEQKYQKKAQNRMRGLNDQEVEYWLNDAQDTLLDTIVNGTSPQRMYSKRDKRLADLLHIRSTIDVPALPDPSLDARVSLLPPLFRYMDGFAVKVSELSGRDCVKDIALVDDYFKGFSVRLKMTQEQLRAVTESNFIQIRINGVEVASTTAFTSDEAISTLSEAVNNDSKYAMYYEEFYRSFLKHTIILTTSDHTIATDSRSYVNNTPPTINNPASIGTTDEQFNTNDMGYTVELVANNVVVVTDTFRQITYLKPTISPVLNPVTRYIPSKETDSDRIEIHKSHPFKRTNKYRVLTDIKDGFVIGYESDDIVIEGFRINYIKIPRRISIDRNISCELAEDLHREVVDIAVARLLSSVDAQRQQMKMLDNQNNLQS